MKTEFDKAVERRRLWILAHRDMSEEEALRNATADVRDRTEMGMRPEEL